MAAPVIDDVVVVAVLGRQPIAPVELVVRTGPTFILSIALCLLLVVALTLLRVSPLRLALGLLWGGPLSLALGLALGVALALLLGSPLDLALGPLLGLQISIALGEGRPSETQRQRHERGNG